MLLYGFGYLPHIFYYSCSMMLPSNLQYMPEYYMTGLLMAYYLGIQIHLDMLPYGFGYLPHMFYYSYSMMLLSSLLYIHEYYMLVLSLA
jgi:hypothetical protein